MACDFACVDSVTLRRFYLLFFIDIPTRRVFYPGITAHRTGNWATQAARNLFLRHGDALAACKALVRDRGSQFTDALDEVFRTEGINNLTTPVGSVALSVRVGRGEAVGMKRRRSCPPIKTGSGSFTGFRFPPEVILLAVRWYLRYGLSYRDLEELLAERGIEVDHVTLYRWVQRFTPLIVDAARPCRHAVGGRWFVDETYVKVTGTWRYVYRAVEQHGQVIDVYVSTKRDVKAATRFFSTAIRAHGEPVEVTTDRSPALARTIVELLPAVHHDTTQYANNRVEADHGRLKARLRPMRGLQRDRTASVIIRGHAFMQNLRRGHYELGVDALPGLTVAAAFDELAPAI